MVTAAFIGPGTVITASVTGARFGYTLLWSLLLAVVVSVVLQEMAARLGIVTGQGLGDNVRQTFRRPVARTPAIVLVVSAIAIGNSAYQGGNLAGASMGLEALIPAAPELADWKLDPWPLLIAAVAFTLLWRGSYRTIERVLIGLVLLMSLAFLVTFVIARPDRAAFVHGLLVPSIPEGAELTVIALIGTTVVPYNLFLHSQSVTQRWQRPEQLPLARRDIYLSIPLGGMVTIAVISTAAAAFFGSGATLREAEEVARSLEPLFGDTAQYFMGVGLVAASVSSALTAPLSASYALGGVLGLDPQPKSWSFRLVWMGVLGVGTVIATLGFEPVPVILFAQIANGLLLPIAAAFLLWEMNTSRLGRYRNSRTQNALGLLVLIVTTLLGGRSLLTALPP